MTLIKDKKSGYYKLRYKSKSGKPKTISTKETEKSEAKKVAKQSKIQEIEQAARSGLITREVIGKILSDKKVTFATAIQDYKEKLKVVGRAESYILNSTIVIEQFARESGLENQPVSAATERQVFDFINNKGSSKASWRRIKLVNLNQFFEFCAFKGWTLGNPAALVSVVMDKLTHAQKEKRHRRPFTDTEIVKLLDATEVGSFWHSAIAIARYTGLRLGDIATLEWDSFSVPGKIIVFTQKRDKRISLPLTPKKLSDAVAAIQRINLKYVFPEERLLMLDFKRRANLSTYFRRICEKVGIEGKSFHQLRNFYATDCKRRGVSTPHIAEKLGHSSTVTTEGYIDKEDE